MGTRLLPITHRLPKPLIPLFHKPLVGWTIEACEKVGINRFAINTHHLPEKWHDFVSLPEYCGHDLSLFHEPLLLDTGGGLKNIASWAGDQPLLVHNGDIFSTLPVEKLIAAHEASGLSVTLAVRSVGGEKRVALDDSLSRVIDVRHELGRNPGTHVFSGIYCVNPEFLSMLPPVGVYSVILGFLQLAKENRLGAVVLDDGEWLDLGNREAYLQAHQRLAIGSEVHPLARVSPDAQIVRSVVGPHAVVAAGACVRNSVLWPGTRVAADARLERCVLFSETETFGIHDDKDL